MGFIQLKSIILWSTQYKVMVVFSSRSVQGCIQADLANELFNIICCMEYSPYVNSVVYTIG